MNRQTITTAVRTRGPDAIRRRLGIDTRSLAAFRIAIGALLLADLLLRSRDLVAFYTDAGVLPRTALLSSVLDPYQFSIHIVSGEAWVQALLFVIAGLFALSLVVGYRTTTVTIISWFLLISLHNRNPLILNGGDVLFRLLLFWAIFLPLGERWSIDSRRSDRERRSHIVSVASFALLLQVVIMYSTNAAMKLGGDAWLRGDGLAYALNLDQFAVVLGPTIREFPLLLMGLNYLWLGLVVFSILLILLAGHLRTGFVMLFVGMHIGMLLTMRLDLFPLISIAGLLAFLPGSFWDIVTPRLSRLRVPTSVKRWPSALDAKLPSIAVSNVPPSLVRVKRALTAGIPAIVLVVVILWNVQFLGYTEVAGYQTLPDEADPLIDATRTDQYWNMFAPNPLSTDGWYVVPGELDDGSQVDALHLEAVQWDRPPNVAATYPSSRWRKYLVGRWRYHNVHRRYLAEYLCHRWNDEHDTRLVSVTIYFMEEPTRLDGSEEPIERVELEEHRC